MKLFSCFIFGNTTFVTNDSVDICNAMNHQINGKCDLNNRVLLNIIVIDDKSYLSISPVFFPVPVYIIIGASVFQMTVVGIAPLSTIKLRAVFDFFFKLLVSVLLKEV